MGSAAPEGLLLREALAQILAEQAAPGLQVDFQEVVTQLRDQPLALGLQEMVGGVGGPAQGGAVGRAQAQFRQGTAGRPGLLLAGGREGREVVASLDPVLDVEAAEPVADQHNPERHGPRAARRHCMGASGFPWSGENSGHLRPGPP